MVHFARCYLPKSAVQDCFPLGSYSCNDAQPQPLLDKLSRSVVAINIIIIQTGRVPKQRDYQT